MALAQASLAVRRASRIVQVQGLGPGQHCVLLELPDAVCHALMQFGDVSATLLGADPEGLVGDVEDRVGFRIRKPCLLLGLLVGALS